MTSQCKTTTITQTVSCHNTEQTYNCILLSHAFCCFSSARVNSDWVLASTEEGGGLREVNYIYAIPCPTGPSKFHVVVLVIDTADKVMIPVAFCFWATEEDLRLEHIPWLTWWDVIGSSTRACSQYYGVFRLPSSTQFPELTAVCPLPWHFLKNKRH